MIQETGIFTNIHVTVGNKLISLQVVQIFRYFLILDIRKLLVLPRQLTLISVNLMSKTLGHGIDLLLLLQILMEITAGNGDANSGCPNCPKHSV